jgi:hypothetical protein
VDLSGERGSIRDIHLGKVRGYFRTPSRTDIRCQVSFPRSSGRFRYAAWVRHLPRGGSCRAVNSSELQRTRAPTALGDRGSIILIPEDPGQGLSGSPSGSVVRTISRFVLEVHLDPKWIGSTNSTCQPQALKLRSSCPCPAFTTAGKPTRPGRPLPCLDFHLPDHKSFKDREGGPRHLIGI